MSDLEALKAALTRQLDTIDKRADDFGMPRELLQDTSGGYIAAPVIVALANVEIALLAHCRCEVVELRSDSGPVETHVDRRSCDVHGGDDA